MSDSDHSDRQPPPVAPVPSSASSSVSPKKISLENVPQSLLTRMGGPSSEKSGVGKGGARSRDEINKIIYKCSANGKFGLNEKIKDEQTTVRINQTKEKLRKMMETIPKGSPKWKKKEAEIDQKIQFLEGTRVLDRLILHADMDMFYAAVELKRDPTLKGKAFGVGKGLLVTCSYEARNWGVSSGMAEFVARALCPHIIIVDSNHEAYSEASREIMKILRSYDPNLCPASLDEAYMDVTEACEDRGIDVDRCVARIREEVQTATGLTASVGIAPNTMLAKICSDFNKPNGQYRILPDRDVIVDFMSNLSVRKIPGIGRVTQRVLDEVLNIKTCKDIFTHRVELSMIYPNTYTGFLAQHLGLGNTKVEPVKREERKSVGREITFGPCSDYDKLKGFLMESAERVAKDLHRLKFDGKTLTVVFKTSTYRKFTRTQTLQTEIMKVEDIKKHGLSIFNNEVLLHPPGCDPLNLRLIGVRISGLRDLSKKNQAASSNAGPLMRAWGINPSSTASTSSSLQGLDSNSLKKRARSEDHHHDSDSSSSPLRSRSGSDASFPIDLCQEDQEEMEKSTLVGIGKGKGKAKASSTTVSDQNKKSRTFHNSSDLTLEEEKQMALAVQRSLEDMRELAELDGEGLTQDDFGFAGIESNADGDEEEEDFQIIDSFDDETGSDRPRSSSKSPIKPKALTGATPTSKFRSESEPDSASPPSSSPILPSDHICPICEKPIKLSKSTLENPEKVLSEVNRHVDLHFSNEINRTQASLESQEARRKNTKGKGKLKSKKSLGPMDRFLRQTDGRI